MVGFATSIKVLMDMGNIGGHHFPSVINRIEGLTIVRFGNLHVNLSKYYELFLSHQEVDRALATLPVMLPLGESLGLTRQITILAFQIGDGISNLVNPTLGGLIAMLSMCRVPIDRWIRFIFSRLDQCAIHCLFGLSFSRRNKI